MKNSHLITDLGPHLLADYSTPRGFHLKLYRLVGLAFATAVFAILCWLVMGTTQAQSAPSDPMVMKIYPDGTKVVLRWSEVGKSVDNGEKFGGAPRIVAYDPAKDGIVPIGEPSQKQESASSASSLPISSSVVSPEKPAKMDYTNGDPETFDDYGVREGFVFRTAAGATFQQPLSARSGNGDYFRVVYQPGIRFDLEPGYNVTDWFRIGAETAFIYNQIHSLSSGGQTFYGSGDPGGLYQVPILASVTFRIPTDGPIRTYIGGGAGGSWSVIQSNNNLESQLGNPGFTNYTWSVVWQVTAGVSYTVVPGLDLDIAYKCLSTPVLNFESSGQSKPLFNHAAEIGLAWRF